MAPFDESIFSDIISAVKGCRSWELLATEGMWGRKGFLVLAGPSNGVQLYVECDHIRRPGRTTEMVWIWGWAPNPFSRLVMVEPNCQSEADLLSILRWVANRAGISTGKLIGIREIPGFQSEESFPFPWPSVGEKVNHQDGWFTRSKIVYRVEKPEWFEGDAFRIAEGIYITFPDGSYRLVQSAKEFFSWPGWSLGPSIPTDIPGVISGYGGPTHRQGDLMVWPAPGDLGEWEGELSFRGLTLDTSHFLLVDESLPEGKGSLDRHTVERNDDGSVVITHPEHATVELPAGKYIIGLLPGTSRPFSRDRDLD